MMESNAIFWLAGECIVGFLFLAAWCYGLRGEISKRVTYESLEERLAKLEKPLNEIHDALLGDMRTEGLISRERRRDDQCVMHKLLKKEIDANK